MKLLVIKPTALGDVAQALTLAPSLRAWSGCTSLAWVIDSDYATLLESCSAIDSIIPFPRRHWRRGRWLFEGPAWARALRGHHFDTVLDLQGLARSALMALASGAPRRIGLDSAREGAPLAYTERVADGSGHAIERYSRAVEQITGRPAEPRPALADPGLPLPEGLEAGSYVVLHPYSLWETKLWPWHYYEQLMLALPQHRFVLVGRGDPFPCLAPNSTDLRGRTGLRDLLSLLARARLVVGSDSGPLHLAACAGTPVLALFGATSPARTAPMGPQAHWMAAGVECQPCLSRHCSNTDPMLCMRELRVSQVTDRMLQIMG